jgi:hypothetical protein
MGEHEGDRTERGHNTGIQVNKKQMTTGIGILLRSSQIHLGEIHWGNCGEQLNMTKATN